MYEATRRTIDELIRAGKVTRKDDALITLALTIAERIDDDGPDCYVSLFGHLLKCIQLLRWDDYQPDLSGVVTIDRG